MHDRLASALLIAKVLVADGMMAEPERAFLARAMETLGLTEKERQQVRDLEGFEEAEKIVATQPEEAKRALVDQLLQAALADGKLSPHETKTIAMLTAALGLG